MHYSQLNVLLRFIETFHTPNKLSSNQPTTIITLYSGCFYKCALIFKEYMLPLCFGLLNASFPQLP